MNSGKGQDTKTTPTESNPGEPDRSASVSNTAVSPSKDRDLPTDAPSGGNAGDVAREIGGRTGPDPARYGDWEKNGRCIDF